MKVLAVLFLVSLASASVIHQSDDSVPDHQKQEDILHLLYKVYEPIRTRFTRIYEASKNFDPTSDVSIYSDGGKAATALLKEVEDHRVLPKKQIFSLFNDRHREEAILFFDTLIHSKSWNTFVSVAAFFREKLNEGVFVYGFYVAVIHSEVARKLALPPLYEITPHLFTNTEAIHQAYEAKMTQTPREFYLNFTGSQRNPEQRVAYFGEDIGMNVHHVTWHMDYPFWWKDTYGHHLDRKGELFFWVHHQLTARFDTERLSNHLDVVDELYWDKPIAEGFAPHTTYKYGGEFPSRPDNIRFQDVEGIVRIRDLKAYESRLRGAIAQGYILDRDGKKYNLDNNEGIELLASALESSQDSLNREYYGSLHNLAHIALGRQGDPQRKYNLPPGVMEHFETATRDPAFFRLHKYIDRIFKEYKDTLPPYTRDDIEFSSVAIESVTVDKVLTTFFEQFRFSLLMAVDDTVDLEDVDLTAIVNRISHEPFTLQVEANNNAGSKVLATVRVYLCPVTDGNGIKLTFDEQRWQCVEFDKFWKNLEPGKNTIVRKSTDASTTVSDLHSYADLVEITEKAKNNGSPLPKFSRSCGIPNRLLIPKGNEGGLEFELVVIVTDGKEDGVNPSFVDHENDETHAQCGIHGEEYPDKRPLGYPLDRRIPDERLFDLPNIHRSKVTIKHDPHHEH